MSNCNCNKLSGKEKATATGVSVVINDPQTAIKLAMEDELNSYAKKDADNITEPDKWKEKLNYLTEQDIAGKANTSDLEGVKSELSATIATKAEAQALETAKEELQEKIKTKADSSALQEANAKIGLIEGLLNVSDDTLDELQEIVTFIKQNKEDLQNLDVSNIAGLEDALGGKVDKEVGKVLSSNDFTNDLKTLLENGQTFALTRAFGNSKKAPSNDLNEIDTSGYYTVRGNNSNGKNTPTEGGYNAAQLLVFSEANLNHYTYSWETTHGNYVTQIFWKPHALNEGIWFRTRNYYKNWGAWQQLVTSRDKRFLGLSQANQTIESGVIREIDVQGRLDFKNLPEKEVANTQFSKVLVLDNKGTLAQKDASNWQKSQLTESNGTTIIVRKTLEEFLKTKPPLGFYKINGGVSVSVLNVDYGGNNCYVQGLIWEFYSFYFFKTDSNGSIRVKYLLEKPLEIDDGEIIHFRRLNRKAFHKAISNITIDINNAIAGEESIFKYNASELPLDSRIKWGRNIEDFKPNTDYIIVLRYILSNVILGTFYEV
ncbi:pyocin knob domain-containing protein [Ornithobacterium rhinotracheale]